MIGDVAQLWQNFLQQFWWLWKALFWYLIMEVSETVGDRYRKMHLIDTTIFWLGETVFTASFKSQALNLNPKLMKLCWGLWIKLSKVWAKFEPLMSYNISRQNADRDMILLVMACQVLATCIKKCSDLSIN